MVVLWRKFRPKKAEGKEMDKIHNKELYDLRFSFMLMDTLKGVNKYGM
jgi:hypothetical protein